MDLWALKEAILSCEALYDGSLYKGNKHDELADTDEPIIDFELLDNHIVNHVANEYLKAKARRDEELWGK